MLGFALLASTCSCLKVAALPIYDASYIENNMEYPPIKDRLCSKSGAA